MVRREAYEKVNGYMVTKYTRRTEDYDLFMRMYANKLKGANIQEGIYHYYIDDNTYKKRKFIYRVDEVITRYKGFKSMGLLPSGLIYVIKPIISRFVPSKLKIWRIKHKLPK